MNTGKLHQLTFEQLAGELLFFSGMITKLERVNASNNVLSGNRVRINAIKWEMIRRNTL